MTENENNQQNVKKSPFFKEFLLPAIISVIVAVITTLITTYIHNEHQRPKLKILGVMPIHLYGSFPGPDNLKFRTHKLALILKIENSSPTPAIVHFAMFEGCIKIPPSVAESHLPKSERLPSGTIINTYYEKHKKSIQRISGSSMVRSDSQSISAHGITYIGLIFPLKAQAAWHTVQGSVSFNGNCAETKTTNPHPAVSQVFDIERVQYDFPTSLRKEFKNGKMLMTLFVGSEQLKIASSLLKPLKSIKSDRWDELALPQMYENPDTAYPPINKNE